MGKREDRRYGGRLAVLTFVLLCLQGTGGQAYAQEDKAGERRIRYSSSYLKEVEIPEAPEEYLEEGEITYRLVGTEIEAVPVRGRTREVSGEMVYPSVTREQEIPARAPMEVEDRESRKTVSVMLDLKRTSYENEHWQDGFEISVVFHEYGADTYRLGGTAVMHDEKVPPLEACREDLLASAGLSRCRLSRKAGREMLIRMRLASGAAMRRYRQNAAYGIAGQCTGERSDFRNMSVTGGGWSMKKRNWMWKR